MNWSTQIDGWINSASHLGRIIKAINQGNNRRKPTMTTKYSIVDRFTGAHYATFDTLKEASHALIQYAEKGLTFVEITTD